MVMLSASWTRVGSHLGLLGFATSSVALSVIWKRRRKPSHSTRERPISGTAIDDNWDQGSDHYKARRISVTQSLPDSQTGKLQSDRKEEGEGGLCAGTHFFGIFLAFGSSLLVSELGLH